MSDRIRLRAQQLILGSLRAMVRALDLLSPSDAIEHLEFFVQVERLAVVGKTLTMRVLGDAWRSSGDRSAADWLAKRTGTTVGGARSVVQTGANLSPGSATDVAFRAGELSLEQAEAVASASTADPSAEDELLATAKHESLQKLRDAAARVRAAAEPDPVARHQRIRKGRYWRRWTDADGARCGTYRLTPEDGAVLEAAAQPFIDAAIDHARKTGEHEASEAYAADGLAAMAASMMTEPDTDTDADVDDGAGGGPGGGGGGGPRMPRGGRGRRRLRDRRELIALVDLAALQRGQVDVGETCEIAGVGPVPVDVARRVFGDALLRIVIRDGVDIRTVVHTGRTANAVQETAVLVRDGGRCVRPTCSLPISEIDHREDYATTGHTTLDQLDGLCGHDHDLKTCHGHSYERDADGRVTWFRPDGTVERERPPPDP